MAITASLRRESGRIVYIESDFPHPFRFRSSKEGPDHIVLNRSRSDLDGLVRFLGKRIWSGSKPVCKSHRAWLWQNATDPLPVSHFQDRYRRSSTDGPDHIEENQAGSDLALADCVRFGPNVSGPEASRCARVFWPVPCVCVYIYSPVLISS